MLQETEEFIDMNVRAESARRSQIMDEEMNAVIARSLPSSLYRPALSVDGDKWCALYGDSLQEGVAGFGDSPAEAYADFNVAWYKKIGA